MWIEQRSGEVRRQNWRRDGVSTADGRSRRSRRTGLTGTDGVDDGANGSVAELGRGSSILWMEIDLMEWGGAAEKDADWGIMAGLLGVVRNEDGAEIE
ncbi:hypothetical protein M0R45_006501 [Rubus argutus]|uniref:Uncharacterized protein n=1 Tax=Rubus argutus TaxID=59490 RepID=A0AAW1YR09_RUBAR